MINIIKEAEKACNEKSPEELADMVGEVGVFWAGTDSDHITISTLNSIVVDEHRREFSNNSCEVYGFFKPFTDSDTGYLVCALRGLL